MKSAKKLKTSHFNNTETYKSEINLLDLPIEMLTHVASFISTNKLKNFGLANKKCQEIYLLRLNQKFIKSVDLRKFFYLDENKMLERVKHLNYRSVNLNLCYNLNYRFVTELVSKASIREMDLIGCQCPSQVIAAVAQLRHLTSLSFSLSNTWRKFFVLNERESLPFLNRLQKLEIFHLCDSEMLIFYAARYVLPHCHQLRSLKLFTMPFYLKHNYKRKESFEVSGFDKTPVPKLESLMLDFSNFKDIYHIINEFLDVILNKKTIPLSNIYLGKQTLNVFYSGKLCRENLNFENADTFCFSRPNYSFHRSLQQQGESLELKAGLMDPVMKSKKYSKMFMENRNLGDVAVFSNLLAKCGTTSLKEVNFNGSAIEKGLSEFITDISSFNSGITFLDISLVRWSPTTDQTNLALINSLANLTNLRTLHMVPSMLRHTECDADALKLSFFEVTQKCTFLKDLRISDWDNTQIISSEVLSLIKFFKNLKKLHLINFKTTGDKAVLPEIIESCTKLKYFLIANIANETKLEEILFHGKSFKHLRIMQSLKLTKTFVDNLIQCSQLEKLYISRFSLEEDVEMIQYLAQSLKKLKKLQIFSSNNLGHFEHYFRSAADEIKEKRPSFFFDDRKEIIPLVHHEFLRQR